MSVSENDAKERAFACRGGGSWSSSSGIRQEFKCKAVFSGSTNNHMSVNISPSEVKTTHGARYRSKMTCLWCLVHELLTA